MNNSILTKDAEKKGLIQRLSKEGYPLMFFYDEEPEGEFSFSRINELTTVGKLHKHHEIREEKGTYVSQYEKTFIVTEKGIEVFN